jgi:(2S)-methylsuccinyl-CoA dehydrogenase
MTQAARKTQEHASGGLALPDLLSLCREALAAADRFKDAARNGVSALVMRGAKVDGAALEREQFAAHGFAWLATYVEGLRQLLGWAERLEGAGHLGERETLILQAGFGEYLAQMSGGIAVSQVEILRPADMGLGERDIDTFRTPAVNALVQGGNTNAVRMRLAALILDGAFGDPALGDETLGMIRDQFRRFAADKVQPFAHEWHRQDVLIPMSVLEEVGQLGVFGLTIPEEFGGLGLGKVAMCVVTEELSRAALAVGSLGTRSEIAGELIRLGGTPEQKAKWLPKIASGEILPTAVFTEPNTGSDLASLKTRAVKASGADGGAVYKVTGNKTWITHAARADLMTLLARTGKPEDGYRGLSMFLAEKPRGTDENPFPAAGMSGGEIKVLGYRGMKEYEIGFDGFEVKADNLLGGTEGQGFKQLMQTFESARIQTAARAVGVAQAAMELARRYAEERVQFGEQLIAFPRVADKIAMMAVEVMIARQITYYAARQKDSGRRCDLEAGMAKLLAARVAWAAADNAVQIHGGNGFALEYPVSRVLCDARILNIFEGAAEIQAHVIARRLLDGSN